MIVKILADSRKILHDRNLDSLEMRPGTDTREQEQLRRIDCASRNDDFACRTSRSELAVLHVLHTNGLRVLDEDLRRGSVQGDVEILAVSDWSQKGARAADSDAVFAVRLGHGEPCYSRAVHVVGQAVSLFNGGAQNVLGYRRQPRESLDVERPAAAVIITAEPGELGIVLRTSEVRQYFRPGPSRVPEGRPVVVISRVTPDIHHPIVNRRTAEILASRPAARATGRETRVRLVTRSVLPVNFRTCSFN